MVFKFTWLSRNIAVIFRFLPYFFLYKFFFIIYMTTVIDINTKLMKTKLMKNSFFMLFIIFVFVSVITLLFSTFTLIPSVRFNRYEPPPLVIKVFTCSSTRICPSFTLSMCFLSSSGRRFSKSQVSSSLISTCLCRLFLFHTNTITCKKYFLK